MVQAPSFQNLDFFSDMGKSLQSASKFGADAYKIGKSAAPTVGQMWKQVDRNSYDQYGVPAGDSFLQAKDMGKSLGGWGAVNQAGMFMTCE